jgi:hypothetical protein
MSASWVARFVRGVTAMFFFLNQKGEVESRGEDCRALIHLNFLMRFRLAIFTCQIINEIFDKIFISFFISSQFFLLVLFLLC